jgi:hypothetical protein
MLHVQLISTEVKTSWWDSVNKGLLLFIGLIILMCSMGVSTSRKEQQHKQAFMQQCLEDKKQYECDFMWGHTAEAGATNRMSTNMAIGMAAGAMAGRR